MYREIVNGGEKEESEFRKTFYKETGKDYNGSVRGIKIDDSINKIRILCPEQLLWLAKAVGIEEVIIDKATIYAKEKIDEMRKNSLKGRYSAKATDFMNKKIEEEYGKSLWGIIKEQLQTISN